MDKKPIPGAVQVLAHDIRCVLAPNPSPMTYWGTNTYILGGEGLAIIDPGPVDPDHRRAIIQAVGDRPVEAVLVTHSHVDHSPLARGIADHFGAPVMAYGTSLAGRSPVMAALAAEGLAGGGEGVDGDFTPDETIKDGARIEGTDWAVEALHTPGHFGNHLCFASGARLFCGDHLMGWASSLVSPPDGDLSQFMRSCHRLLERRWSVAYAGHGAPIADPVGRLRWLVEHRLGREAQILAALSDMMTLETLTEAVYADVDPSLLPAAQRNVFAHLIDLDQRGLVAATPRLSAAPGIEFKKL